MSVWADIHRRANGLQERKEDKIWPPQEDDLEFLRKKISEAARIPMDVFRASYIIEPINKINI